MMRKRVYYQVDGGHGGTVFHEQHPSLSHTNNACSMPMHIAKSSSYSGVTCIWFIAAFLLH